MQISPPINWRNSAQSGFTLIELSIVLVIIGLIIGGILTGQDLINAAAIRAQISQIEHYNTAVRTFQGKYGYLPGDIPNPYATQFGFQARGSFAGEGDGNGILEGNYTNVDGGNNGFAGSAGETATFWVDLSAAQLIDSGITYLGTNYPNPTTYPFPNISSSSTPTLNAWLPPAKIGQSNYVYVYSVSGINYFNVSAVQAIAQFYNISGNPGLTVQQAYNIDSKVDDGLPQSGNVTACFSNGTLGGGGAIWAAGYPERGPPNLGGCTPTTAATNYQTYNCYDNATPGSAANAGGVAGTEKYSINQNAGVTNCALSFRFQ